MADQIQAQSNNGTNDIEALSARQFSAALSSKDILRIADVHDSDTPTRRSNFRTALAILKSSSEDIMIGCSDDPVDAYDTFEEAYQCVSSAIDQHKREIEMMETAAARLLVICAKCVALMPEDTQSKGAL